jgi:hypothetical protein
LERDPPINPMSHEQGWIFPIALLSIVFLATLTSFMTARATGLGQRYHDGVQSSALHQAFRLGLLPASALPRGCSTQSATALGLAGSWWVCTERDPSFRTIPTVATPPAPPDFDLLLSRAETCLGQRAAVQNKRFESPTAPFTCALRDTLTSGAISLDNIAMESPILEGSDSVPVVTIASPGYLSVSGELRSAQDLLVVVGGNIRVERIRGVGHRPIRVTLFSSRGDIEVGSVSGPLSLLAIGRSALHVPSTPFLPPFPLPRERVPTILGLAPNRGGWD